MKILALDQATKTSGYSLWKNNKLVDYGIFESNIKANVPLDRMLKMTDLIEEFILKVSPDFVVIEGVQFRKNYNTYMQLCQMQGLLFEVFHKLKIPFKVIQATSWKSFCGITGKKREEQKANTIAYVKEQFKINATEDEADAIGIGVWAIHNIEEDF